MDEKGEGDLMIGMFGIWLYFRIDGREALHR